MRRASAITLLVFGLTACVGSAPAPGRASSATIASPLGTPSGEPSATAAPTPQLPPGLPTSFDQDVPAAEVPLRKLIPQGADVDGSWFADTDQGEAIVVAYATPTGDPFRQIHGTAVWRRFNEAPAWRATYGVSFARGDGVLGIQAMTGDVTGDGSDDLLLAAATGGTGTCSLWSVIDIAAASRVFERDLCDGQLAASSDPIGLTMTEAVFKPGDSHCCPSAIRTTVLTYDGAGSWTVVSREVTPL
jgi:hypothetical protein